MTAADQLNRERPELSKFAPVLRRLEAESHLRLGVSKPGFEFERFMSRPYSEIVQLLVTAPDTAPRRVFVKIARAGATIAERESMSRKVAWAFDAMTQLHGAMALQPGLSVARPIACYPEHLTIVTEGAKGLTLLALVESQARWWPSPTRLDGLRHSLSRIGEWLRRYQDLSADDRRTFSLAEMREYVDVRLKILADLPHTRFTPADRLQSLDAFDRRAVALSGVEIPTAPVHADFAPGNVLVDGGDIVVLDFAVPARGSVYHDVAHLYMQLDLLAAKPQFRPSVTRALQTALLNGFEPGLAPEQPLFQLLLFQHVVCHFTGLARSGGNLATRAYNWHLQRRHRSWLRAFSRQ